MYREPELYLIEHCIGILKARFSSLRCLPNRILAGSDLNWTHAWIGACIILHNLLIDDAESAPTAEEIQQILDEERLGNEDHDENNQQELTGQQQKVALVKQLPLAMSSFK
ncbi:hypothetical protein FN846DRAFT_1009398 [Sphaerosporella brunnea]|uniref:DDE Tnp4 domain-containing protein n=1 Tax=Sphaerosporella brunnea TaxID=1250544 RepID=A0A5J5FA54_9PEZI|nr:hypothetical protein FN846DRAFT_1009398 [Sphaerosporella brunnea]